MCLSLAGNRVASKDTGAASDEPSGVRVKEKKGTSGDGVDTLEEVDWERERRGLVVWGFTV